MDFGLPLSDTFIKLGIALGLGLLIGLQRERTDSRVAGIRTFPVVTVFGSITALLALQFGGWILAAGLVSLAALVIISNFAASKRPLDPGVTTEVAIFLMFGIGAYLVAGHAAVAIVLVGVIALLLHLKPQMHAFARKMGEKDFTAIMQFVLVSLVILPVLPNENYGPYDVFNPRTIWLMVVLVVGFDLAGYVAYKIFGAKGGSILAGVLGGLISSTATTVTYARRTRESPESSPAAAFVIMLASTVVFVRLLALVGIVAPHRFTAVAGPITAMLVSVALISGAARLFAHKESFVIPNQKNPSEFKPAVIFAAVFAVVLLGVAIAKEHFGTSGLYAVAAFSGLTDMDAITLSTLKMELNDGESLDVIWRMILVASLANLVFKAAIAAVLGGRKMFMRLTLLFGLAFVAGVLILGFWPSDSIGDVPSSLPAAATSKESE